MKVQELTQKLQEEKTDHAAMKKKYTASIKELKHELSSLRKQMDASTGNGPLAPPPSGDSVPSTSSRSRASSINSLDRATTVSREEDGSQGGHAAANETNAIQQVMIDKIIVLQKKLARRNDKIEFLEEHGVGTINSLDRATTVSREEDGSQGGHAAANETNAIQQVMIDKIIVLQKKLARRNDKIEFLEEHVRHCLEELQKKTKIIQHYALREEASLLLPSDGTLDQVLLSGYVEL
ncbi:hypothetical protein OESDEN_15812 [Oesophagostomum dentatum]|uniref:Uncharacterized protein n=1 Tax=Oesophagostomum dentatum TaxID=61180 RepID=A0A0B1SGK5_OESDE|nr:hypothetical protein OESDEN_15812 [Oesophagostomum dentatum]